MSKWILNVILLLCATALLSQQKFEWPRNESGKKMISEKFEILEHFMNNLNNIPRQDIEEDDPTLLLKRDGEVLVGDSGKNEFEVHAVVNPIDPNNIVIGAMDTDLSSIVDPVKFSIYVTKDFGDTWVKSDFNGMDPAYIPAGGGDPMFAFDDRGNLYFAYLLINISGVDMDALWGIYMAVSTDGGLTWDKIKEPVEESYFQDLSTLSDLESATDKEWMTSDLSDDSPHKGNVYISYVEIDVQDERYDIIVRRKFPDETTFTDTRNVISDSTFYFSQFANMDVDSRGNLYTIFLADDDEDATGNYGIYLSKSTDGATTFLPSSKVVDFSFPEIQSGDIEVTGVSPSRLYPCPQLAIDRSGTSSDGTLYISFTASGIEQQESDGLDIYIMASYDGGVTWTDPIIVNDDIDPDTHQFYSSITVNEDGDVAIGWYDMRSEISNDQAEYYVGISYDLGRTFVQLSASTQASDFNLIGSNNLNTGIGEYNQILNSGDYIIPVWADGRTNDGDIAIYANFFKKDLISSVDKVALVNSKMAVIGPVPNPSTHSAEVMLTLEKSMDLRIYLTDLNGRIISNIANREFQSGLNTIEIGTAELSGGFYYFTIVSEEGKLTRKLNVIK